LGRPLRRLLTLALLLVLAYGLYPYLTLAWLLAVASAPDGALDPLVDLAAVRASLERQIAARLAEGAAPSPSSAEIARSLADQLSRPESIRAVLRNRGRLPPLGGDALGAASDPAPDVSGGQPARVRLGELDWIFFTDATRFEVRGRRGALVLALEAGWWRLVDLRLPTAPGESS